VAREDTQTKEASTKEPEVVITGAKKRRPFPKPEDEKRPSSE
jgi:hypothetical protein